MNTKEFFEDLYLNFNARHIENVLVLLSEDVKWANGMEGGFVHGRDAVREYWTRQFTMANPQVTPQEITDDAGKTVVKVHQIVKDMDGNLILDLMIDHIFHLENGLVKTFEIGEAPEWFKK